MMTRRRILDRLAALFLLAAILSFHFSATFNRLEWEDWIAYALPSANLIERGVLATPQLGTQCGLDRYWLWNSPLMGAGPAIPFLLFGVGRESYLLGCLALDVALMGAFVVMARRSLDLRGWAVPVLVMIALLGTRTYLAELTMQRYTPLAFLSLAVLFLPRPSPIPTAPRWRWSLAGVMPLIHPALVFGSATWAIGEVIRWIRARRRDASVRFPGVGLVVFALGVVACALWYLRREPLMEQFLPQIRGVGGRSGWDVPASWIAAPPTLATYALICVVAAVAAIRVGPDRPESGAVRLSALTLALIVTYDLAFGFGLYLKFYMIGLALPCLSGLRGDPSRTPAVAALVLLGLSHLTICLWLDRQAPLWTDAAETREFVLRHTRPGDRIVLGPPFVLVAGEAGLPGRRVVRYVVPQPYKIDAVFDYRRFRSQIRDETDVYLGRPLFFHAIESSKVDLEDWRGDPTLVPLYPLGVIDSGTYEGQEIYVARAIHPGNSPATQAAEGEGPGHSDKTPGIEK